MSDVTGNYAGKEADKGDETVAQWSGMASEDISS